MNHQLWYYLSEKQRHCLTYKNDYRIASLQMSETIVLQKVEMLNNHVLFRIVFVCFVLYCFVSLIIFIDYLYILCSKIAQLIVTNGFISRGCSSSIPSKSNIIFWSLKGINFNTESMPFRLQPDDIKSASKGEHA